MEMKEGKILVVDDNENILHSLRLLLQLEFGGVFTLQSPHQINEILKTTDIDIVLLDMNFTAGKNSGAEGIMWLRNILEIDPHAIVVMMTAYGDVELAVKAVREGAVDFVLKPWENNKLLSSLQSAFQLRQSRKNIRNLKDKQHHLRDELNRDYAFFLGNSPGMKEVIETIDKVAGTDANILILGENGTGKELIARDIHRKSTRSEEVFISVDLGTLSATLFESELFGHMKGSFTDASEDWIGRFETASGGTLFLDEIGNLPLSLQAKLLNALENREIIPIGSNRTVPVDIRLICATNQPLSLMIENHLFREDLFYRMNTIEIEVPPLRERGSDILLLAQHFIRQYAAKYGKPVPQISRKTANQLMEHSWPGNVRELKHTMEKAVILNDSRILQSGELISSAYSGIEPARTQIRSLEETEIEVIRKVLKKNHGNISRSAGELKIARQTLYNKMEKYGI